MITSEDEDDIIDGIASCSDDIDASNVEIISITDSSSTRRRYLLVNVSGVDINYTTTIILDGTDYASASALFSTVSAVVTSAVFTGNLTNYIQSAASNSNRYVL